MSFFTKDFWKPKRIEVLTPRDVRNRKDLVQITVRRSKNTRDLLVELNGSKGTQSAGTNVSYEGREGLTIRDLASRLNIPRDEVKRKLERGAITFVVSRD